MILVGNASIVRLIKTFVAHQTVCWVLARNNRSSLLIGRESGNVPEGGRTWALTVTGILNASLGLSPGHRTPQLACLTLISRLLAIVFHPSPQETKLYPAMSRTTRARGTLQFSRFVYRV